MLRRTSAHTEIVSSALFFFFFCLGNVTISNVRILRASLTSPTSRPLHSITTASRILKESQLPSMLMLFIWVERPGFLFFHGPGSHYLAWACSRPPREVIKSFSDRKLRIIQRCGRLKRPHCWISTCDPKVQRHFRASYSITSFLNEKKRSCL